MIGLKPSEFWDLLPRQFFLMQKAFYKKQEQRTQESWEQTRWLATFVLQPHMKKGKKLIFVYLFPSKQLDSKLFISSCLKNGFVTHTLNWYLLLLPYLESQSLIIFSVCFLFLPCTLYYPSCKV